MTLDWTIKITDVAIVIAAILGPILAVQAQKALERHREIKERRSRIFRTLMATRALNLSPAHVEALNAIPLEFYGDDSKLRSIKNKWKAYLDYLGNDQVAPEVWNSKRADLFIDLLRAMATYLEYDFNDVELAKDIYAPKGHVAIETDQDMIRRGLARLLSGELSLPMDVKSFPVDPAAARETEELRRLLLRWLRGEAPVPVAVQPTPTSSITREAGKG
jgi:hypothetical protein